MSIIANYRPDTGELEYSQRYGRCSHCGGPLVPIWFTEEETVVSHGVMYKTGRKRQACSHLTCVFCLRNEIVDDSFDGRWY